MACKKLYHSGSVWRPSLGYTALWNKVQSCFLMVPLTKIIYSWETLLITSVLHKPHRWNYERHRSSMHCKLKSRSAVTARNGIWKRSGCKRGPRKGAALKLPQRREMNSYQPEGCASAHVGNHSSACKSLYLCLYLLLHRTMSTCSSGTSSSVGSQAAQW